MHPGEHARRHPDKPAVVMADGGQTTTYRQLDERSNQGAQLFRSLGLAAGESIAFCLENHPRFFELCWAAQRSGLIYTPISSRLTPDEVAYIVGDCGARAFLTSAALGELADGLAGRLPGVKHHLVLDEARRGWTSWEEATAAQPATPIADEVEGADMLYSSGTTGRPKGVVVRGAGAPFGTTPPLLALMGVLYGCDESSVYLSPAPLYHAAPLRFNLAMQRIGATCVVMEHFDALRALELIEAHRVTHGQWVPTMFVRMLKLPEAERVRFDVSSLRCAIHAAAPCPIPVKEQMIEWWGPVIHEYYAGTEGNGFTAIDSETWLRKKGSVGRPLRGEVHVLGEHGEELPAGETGTVYFGGGESFEYHNDPEKTAASRTASGWSTLGDVGYLDDEGFLFLTDRKAYMIISGGVNIYPQEAENVLVTHPRVADVAVFGVPNEEFGEEVKAAVQLLDPDEAGPELAEELLAWCRERLAHVKCPRSIDFERELPRHPTGKLYKRLLRDRYWKGHESRIV